MRRPTERGASGREWGQPDRIAEGTDDDEIIPLAPRLGNCINCGQYIRLVGGATTCPTCSAWRRWYSAHRIASRYLREVPR